MSKIINFIKDFKWVIIFLILLQIVLSIVIPKCVIRFQVNGSSMNDTFQNEDVLIGREYVLSSPKKGDIVVFKSHEGPDYIKRIIATPGDTISMKENVVKVNGSVISEPYIKKPNEYINVDEIKIPKNQYFVMGDNRDQSKDSRYEEVGLVDISEIKAKIYMRVKPTIKFGY